jgi:proprotein convertase subtilisin/kexin type 5
VHALTSVRVAGCLGLCVSVGVFVAPQCSPCAAGRYYQSTVGRCLACDVGKYNRDVASTSCYACSPGFVPNANRDGCLGCARGTSPSLNGDACESCAAGRFAALANTAECVPCPRGRYSEARALTCPVSRRARGAASARP